MNVKLHMTCVLGVISVMLLSSCSSTTNQASASTPAAGYHHGTYYLTESEKNLTAEEVVLRIKEEARICAAPGNQSVKKSFLSNAVKFGTGVAVGVGVDPEANKKSPAEMSRARMTAYNARLTELGHQPLNLNEEISAVIAAQNQPMTTAAVQ